MPEARRDGDRDAAADDAPIPEGTCLAFDFGIKRIGVAVGETRLGRARPLGMIANAEGTPDWPAIDRLIAEWRPVALVVGLPLAEDGTEQPVTAQARGFMKRLAKRTALPTPAQDERYSSIEARSSFREARASGRRTRRARAGDLDALAAAHILERWFAGTAS